VVVLGVAAEGVLESLDHNADGILQTFDEVLLTATQNDAGSARREADTFAREIATAKRQAADAESDFAKASQRAANAEAELEQLRLSIPPRRLSQEQKESLKRLLAGEPKAGVGIWSLIEDSETTDFATDIILSLRGAGWNPMGPTKLSVAVERPPAGDPVGIQFSVRPGGKLTPAAIRLQRAFLAIGIPSGVVEAPNADAYGVNIIVGHKAIPPIKSTPSTKR
jgi:hypothetical protein